MVSHTPVSRFSRRAFFKTANKPFIIEQRNKPVKSTQAVFQQANLWAWKTAARWQLRNKCPTTPSRHRSASYESCLDSDRDVTINGIMAVNVIKTV